MSKFLTKLDLELANDSDDGKWIVTSCLLYESAVLRGNVAVPVGFQTDLASVPRLPIVYLLAGDSATEAAVVHDYLYTTKQVCRATADDVLYEASLVSGVPRWRAALMWAGVRVFGGSHW